MKPMTAPAMAPFSDTERAPITALLEVLSAPLADPEREPLADPDPPVAFADEEPVAVALGEMEAKNDAADEYRSSDLN